MPWRETCRVNERMSFICRLRAGERMADLCREFQISRKTGYALKKRFEERGAEALLDQSRAPRAIPHRTPEATRGLILAARREHPTWGPKKLKAWLSRKHAGVRFPAVSTIGEILKKAGLVKERKRRAGRKAKPTDLRVAASPNELWCADFKGQFQLGNGRYCYPLTITDAYSRYLIACVALEGTAGGPAQVVFEEAFRRHGLPMAIRTDNGSPFASTGLGGLTALSAWWLRLGVEPERIEPGHPEQNGQHERMHRTLKAETTRPAGRTMLQQQERFDAFVAEFNEERPHEALGQATPGSLYESSDRSLERALELGAYPHHDYVLPVSSSGSVWVRNRILPKQRCVYLAQHLAGYEVGLREEPDGRWLVTFMDLDLGHLDPDVGFDPAPELL